VAPSPIIPTSFVPKQPVRATGRLSKSGGNLFLLASILLAFVSVVAAGGVFAYQYYLEGVRDTKRAAVEKAEQSINTAAVEDFIRTRDRFQAASGLLDGHVSASRFFALLEGITLTSVRFNTLSFALAEDNSAIITMEGVARTFNALAAQSSALSNERDIKRAIFSDIQVDDETNTVTFTLSAELAPSLLEFLVPEAPAPQLPEALPEVPSTSDVEEAVVEPVPPADPLPTL